MWTALDSFLVVIMLIPLNCGVHQENSKAWSIFWHSSIMRKMYIVYTCKCIFILLFLDTILKYKRILDEDVYTSGSQNMIPRRASWAAPANKCQLSDHPRPTESEPLGVRLRNVCSNEPIGYYDATNVWKPWTRHTGQKIVLTILTWTVECFLDQ